MIKVSRELKTGFFAIVVISLFVWGYNYLKGHNLFDGPADTYFTEYDNIQGLNTASSVTVNGFDVGKVVGITFNDNPNKKGLLRVEFSVEKDFVFSKNSIAKIYSASLMGGKSLAIVPSYEGDQAVPGDYLKGEIESDMFSSVEEKLNPLQAKLESVIVSADSLLVNMNGIIDEQSIVSIKQGILSFESTLLSLENAAKNADSIVAENKSSLKTSVRNVEKITKNFSKFTDSLSQVDIGLLVAKIQSTVDNLNRLTTKLNSGEGTVGKLIKDDAVYINLSNAAKELEELLRDIKLNPKKFVHFSVFGKKDKTSKTE